MLGGSGGSGGSNECNRVAHSRTKKYPALWRPYFWNQPRSTEVKINHKNTEPRNIVVVTVILSKLHIVTQNRMHTVKII
jgi:hypothetical protein